MRVLRAAFAVAALLFLNAGGAFAQEAAWFGVSVETVTPALMAEKSLAVPFGARVTGVDAESPAAEAGLEEGDVVISVNGAVVMDAAAFETAVGQLAAGASADLMRMRGKEAQPVTVRLAEKPDLAEPSAATAMLPLMLDTGGHMSLIRTVLFTPDGKFLISASDDKVVRVWDWRAGKTVRTIRGESGAGDEGKMFAMALSRDGTKLAIGGRLTGSGQLQWAVRIHDFATGKLLSLLKGHDDIILGLAFSPDGRRLISSSADKTAIVWDLAPGPGQGPRLLHRLSGHTDFIFAVVFTADGQRVMTGSDDHTLRIWGVGSPETAGKQIALLDAHSGKIRALAVSPKDGAIASGSWDGEIRLWDMKGAGLKAAPASRVLGKQGTNADVLAFSPDGNRLVSGVVKTVADSRPYTVHVWNVTTGEEVVTYGGHNNVVIAAAISPDGRFAVTGGGDNQEIHVWDLATGARAEGPGGKPLMLAGSGASGWSVGFSADGRSIAWGNTWSRSEPAEGYGALEFQLRLPAKGFALGAPERIASSPSASELEDKDFTRASAARGVYSLRHREGGHYGYNAILDVIKDGKTIASLERGSPNGLRHLSYTFTPDGKTIVSGGGNGALQAFDLAQVTAAAKGGVVSGAGFQNLIRPFIGHESDVWGVAPSPDGRYLASSSNDQTIRLWNLKTQELIVTLFHGRDGEWAMWTPQGYYTGSPGGGALVGWQINKGPGVSAEYVRGRQLREKLLRPDIVERAIVLASAKSALKEAGLENISIEAFLTRVPPELDVAAGAEAAGGRGIVYVSSAPNPLPMTLTKITVGDGKQETAVEPRPVAMPPGTPRPEKGATVRAYEVPLFKGENIVRVVAVNAAGESEPRNVTINHNGEGALDKRGTLWVLAVGADKYPGAKAIADKATGETFLYDDLTYAGVDAAAFAGTAAIKMKGRHTLVDATVLVNGADPAKEPTRANILGALKRIAASSKDNDTVVIMFAGHGENWTGGRYHFLPTDFKRSDKGQIGENVLDWGADIQPAVTGARGRKLLFLDACHSGNAYNKTLLASADADRFVAFSAASADESAIEFAAEGHGAFTYMLIQGLKGADAARDSLEKAVTVYALGKFVNEEVRRRTNGKQTPEFRSGQGNFVLARE